MLIIIIHLHVDIVPDLTWIVFGFHGPRSYFVRRIGYSCTMMYHVRTKGLTFQKDKNE